jgi:hypothetical protein
MSFAQPSDPSTILRNSQHAGTFENAQTVRYGT